MTGRGYRLHQGPLRETLMERAKTTRWLSAVEATAAEAGEKNFPILKTFPSIAVLDNY